MPLSGKQIAVTGGGGGIGAPLCTELLARGAMITVIGRTQALPDKAEFLHGDLSTVEGIIDVAGKLRSRRVDILINLAGVQYFGLCEQEPPEHTARLFTLNLLAPVMLAQALLPQMKARGDGQIVNIGSIFGSINFAHFATYSSSKAGLRGFSQALGREVRDAGVAVTYVAPRAVKTAFNSTRVLEYGRLTKMNMDPPEWVAAEITKAIVKRKKEVFLGFPEKLFVRLNAIAPHLVDQALAANDGKAKALFNQPRAK